jgi:sugar phosphate isomerase/epimerase
MTLAVSTAAFDGHPWEAALDALASLGVRRVEPAFIKGYVAFGEDAFAAAPAARLSRLMAERGLGVQGVSAHMDLSGPEAGAMLARRIDFAATLGASVLVTNAGPAAGRDAILARIEEALPRLEEAGLVLALENPGHGAGDLIGRGQDGAALVRDLGAPKVRLNLDVGNLLTYAGQVGPGLSAALPFAAHAHLKDVAEDGPDWRFVPLGDGLVDWGEAKAAMARLAPGLPVALELPLRLRRPRRGDPVRGDKPVPLSTIVEALRRSLVAWAAA